MNESTAKTTGNGSGAGGRPLDPSEGPVSYLAQEYERWKSAYQRQPARLQRFLEVQAQALAGALTQNLPQVDFRMPDQVVIEKMGSLLTIPVPDEDREQLVGGLIGRLTRSRLSNALHQRLDELEASPKAGVDAAAGLIRFTTAMYLVTNMLPSGRTVAYQANDDEEIPSLPVENSAEVGSAITAETDAIVEEDGEAVNIGRGELQVPFVPWARRFYLPQWVALDDEDRLLTGSLSEAEAHLASMQQFLRVLHTAVSIAAYIVADEQYQRKRYGMLGQLFNQGRALARYETRQITQTIQRRAAAHSLNRGLALSLPYFDDQALEMKTYDFQVIPSGRIMFVPAFVVRACLEEEVKVAQDTRISLSTRRHLLSLLKMIAAAFEPSDE